LSNSLLLPGSKGKRRTDDRRG